MNETYIDIKRIAEIKELKSTRAIRIAIQKGKYVTREIKVNGGTSYEILYSSLEPEIQEKLEDGKTNMLIKQSTVLDFFHARRVSLLCLSAQSAQSARYPVVAVQKSALPPVWIK